ncbi:hypothetical protein EHW67_19000 [Arenibacter aquaticus]|uniref:F5/8 type C domain-containing protein n=1 Tax=Arenibacter aquaticus TaxID=2489054 RepID=A0A3S0BV30_9FLAO|nr:DUF4998 domain-containing protein [Arenibacter aquaticus]RTE52272.1 hypothetical protein EHW67_19000 [Arenibacter aquaticus]
MKKSTRIIYFALLAIGIFFAVASCEETTETYSEFTKDGEIIYVGTPDTVIVAPGYEKLQFSIVINADPKISSGVLQTKDKSFVQEFDVQRQNIGQDTILFIANLDEGEYNFDVYLKDDSGNTSIPREVTTVVYGSKYQNTLLSRSISAIKVFESEAILSWGDVPNGSISTSLSYEDADGAMQTIEIPNDINETILTSYNLGGQIIVESIYAPSPNAIEVFTASSETVFPEQFQLNHTNITALRLPFDASDGCYVSSYERLTDGATGEYWHSCDSAEDQYPFVMSFDIGVSANLSGFRLDKRSACCGGRSPGAYQIWATNDLTGAETADIDAGELSDWEADATAKGWVKLIDVTGNTQETFEVEILENAENYRYIRIVGISSINGELNANFDEFTFFASGVE